MARQHAETEGKVFGMPDAVTPFIGPATSILKSVFAAFRRKFGKRKANELVSAVIVELLQENPDLTAAEAKLMAARATGVDPDMDLLRAESMLRAAQSHKRRKGGARRATISAAARARWARLRAPKKRAKKKRRRK
jgi:hypothetical protein